MRWLAAALIMTFSLLTGRCFADRLRQRRKLLECLNDFVRRMSAQISYALVPPERVIRDCNDGEGGFFCCCAAQLDKGVAVEQAWSKAAEDCAAVSALRADERRLLNKLGSDLGKYDTQLQLSVLNSFAGQLEVLCRTAASEHCEQSRLYSTCSLLAGALLSILII